MCVRVFVCVRAYVRALVILTVLLFCFLLGNGLWASSVCVEIAHKRVYYYIIIIKKKKKKKKKKKREKSGELAHKWVRYYYFIF